MHTEADTDERIPSRPRRGKAAKGASKPAPDRVKVSIVLAADVDFKLSVAAAALRMDRSALVNQVLSESATLKRFVVQDRAKPAPEAAGEHGAG